MQLIGRLENTNTANTRSITTQHYSKNSDGLIISYTDLRHLHTVTENVNHVYRSFVKHTLNSCDKADVKKRVFAD